MYSSCIRAISSPCLRVMVWSEWASGVSVTTYVDALERAVREVDGERDEEQLEVPGQRLGCLVVDGVAGVAGRPGRGGGRGGRGVLGVAGSAGVDDPSAGGTGAVDSDRGGREEAVAGDAPGHGLIPADLAAFRGTGSEPGGGRGLSGCGAGPGA